MLHTTTADRAATALPHAARLPRPRALVGGLRWFALALLTLSGLGVLSGAPPPTAAVAATSLDLLATASLDSTDLPGYRATAASTSVDPMGATFSLDLDREDTPGVRVTVILRTSTQPLPATGVPAAFAQITGLTRFHNPATYRTFGQLGIGTADQAAAWDRWNVARGGWDRYYEDQFRVGDVLAAVLYSAPVALSDPGLLTVYAHQQAAKLTALLAGS